MGRFELEDGELRRFWEVGLEGEVVHFRSGDLGTDGRLVSRRYRSERAAQDVYDQAVRAMVSQGYAQVLHLPEPELRACDQAGWDALEADPDDVDALAVHADWLQASGDPRGAQLALDLAAPLDDQVAAAAAAHRTEHLDALAGPVAAFPGEVRLEWGPGYVRGARFESGSQRGADPAGLAAELLAGPGFRLLRRLVLYVPSAVRVASAARLPALRELTVHAGVVSWSVSPPAPLDLDLLAERSPRLTSLTVRGGSQIVGSAGLRGLEALDVRCASEWTALLVDGGAPGLRRLGYHGVDAGSLRRLQAAGVFGGLETLAFTPAWDTPIDRALKVLVGAVSRPLDLHLSGVELDARTARLLLRLPLRSLTLDGTLSEEARRTLDRAPFAVDGRQRVRAPAGASDVEPPRPPDLALTRLELIDGGSQWFWSIGLDGAVHHVHHGRAGTRGTWSWKRFPTDDVAEELLERRIEEKLREGFTPVEARPQRTLAEA